MTSIKEDRQALLSEYQMKYRAYTEKGEPTDEEALELALLREEISALEDSLRFAAGTKHRSYRISPSPPALRPVEQYILEACEEEVPQLRLTELRPPGKRQSLYYTELLEGLNCGQIAKKHGISPSTVSRTLQKAKRSVNADAEIKTLALSLAEPESGRLCLDLSNKVHLNFVRRLLTEAQLAAFLACYRDGMTRTEYAALRGLHSSTVSRTLKRALHELRSAFPQGAEVEVKRGGGSRAESEPFHSPNEYDVIAGSHAKGLRGKALKAPCGKLEESQ